MKKCKNCGKEIPDNLTFCSQECVKKLKQAEEEKFRKAFPIGTKILEEEETAVKVALFNMKDKQFQAGLVWRMKQCEAVRSLVANGWSREDILREFRHNGMTALTANKIIDDALC